MAWSKKVRNIYSSFCKLAEFHLTVTQMDNAKQQHEKKNDKYGRSFKQPRCLKEGGAMS